MKIDVQKNPIKITLGGTLPAGSGVGASAAGCVSLAWALNETFSLGLSIDGINHVGWEGEFAYHSTPSGVDNTASTYGGVLFYRVKTKKKCLINYRLSIHLRSCWPIAASPLTPQSWVGISLN